jgi:UDP-2,3-diacylglucosamine hydrolase
MNDDTLYFVSDAHLGAPFADAPEWERTCTEFLRSLPDRATSLYILGDLFDFWIEYPHAIRPEYFQTVHELRNLIDRGVEVHYLAGNHDFALGPFLTQTIGIKVYTDNLRTVLQGRQVLMHHGDGLIRKDVRYRILKRLLRNQFNQKLYKLLPMSIGVPLGSFCSGTSRKMNEHRMTEAILSEYRDAAKTYLDQGNDIVFFAHTHEAELSRWGEKAYCNTGAWMRTFNFATMERGMVRLWVWRNDQEPSELPAIERK